MRLDHVQDWRMRLGYLPVPLNYGVNEHRYVMLNGAKGNFCLDISENEVGPQAWRQTAWSSDVDHYVRIRRDRVEVARWDHAQLVGSSVSDVINNLAGFQQYLESSKAPREQSVVAHAVTTYNRIRALLPQDQAGLEAFLYALTLAISQSDVSHASGRLEWSDIDSCQASWEKISQSNRSRIFEDFLHPRASDKSLDISLMMRHAMGRIFQDAHNLVALSPQLSLLGDGDLITVGSTSHASGAYFTPTPLVRTLVEQCLTPEILARERLVIFDPACGSGEFLREAVRQLDLHAYTGQVQLIGFDVSLAAVLMARFSLAAETVRHGRRFAISVTQTNALETEWPTQVDLCLMNPPYASWRTLATEARRQVTDLLGDLARSRPDLAFVFLLNASNCLRDGGMLGAVLPASLLDGDSARALRAKLDSEMSRRVVVRLGNQAIFAAATVDTSLYVGTRLEEPRADSDTLMVWADHSSGASDRALRALRSLGHVNAGDPVKADGEGFSIYTEPEVEGRSNGWAPRPTASRTLLSAFSRLPKVGDLYDINQGVITGLNLAFLLDANDFKLIPRGERKFFRKAVVNASIRDGRISDGHWVFYPYGPHLPALDDEDALAEHLPAFKQNFLTPHRTALRQRNLSSGRWWDLTRKRSIHEQRLPLILSTYFGNAGSFAWDSKGEYVVVQGYAWTPKAVGLLDENLNLATVAILSSSTIQRLIAAVSNTLSGGQFNLSARFVEKMPFVNLMTPELGGFVEELALIGAAIGEGAPYSVERRDSLVSDLYTSASGLSA
ncbi:class I SAM-dependent DNA methyltransferase [Burkholderia territorii]|uniref:HsdM family class I SAM-dependent methyltransferase n=2 Tax=Burkholderia territorii TaxID=1503055 RepID=UPI0009C00715|nr:N-6 DNA methylase [Burkholderia territorii]